MPKSIRQQILSLLTIFLFIPGLPGQESGLHELEPYPVTATRSGQDAPHSPGTITWNREDLDLNNPITLESALREIPDFSTFRNNTSVGAHPTTHGVRLRGVGTSGVSRALVLLDGIPQNDPLGGWVYWGKYSPQSLDSVTLSPSGGNGAWGNLEAGGLISLHTIPVSRDIRAFSFSAGSANTFVADAMVQESFTDDEHVGFNGRVLSSDGYFVIPGDRRGPVDTRASMDAHNLQTRIQLSLGQNLNLQSKIGYYEESKNNGTPRENNETESYDFSLRITPKTGADWEMLLYRQESTLQNTFTSVNEERTQDRVVLDQFHVPSDAWGGAFTLETEPILGFTLLGGVDFRRIEGEINERYRNLGDGFTRRRKAGGIQGFYGTFVKLTREFSESWNNELTLRADYVEQEDGFRTEWDTENNSILLESDFPERSKREWSINYKTQWIISPHFRTSLSLYRGFRSPTLNELYRPFRVGNDITEANPQLKNESISGASIEASWDPTSSVSLSAEWFANELDDMIANVVLSTEPGFHDLCGFVPEGGSCGQRLNVRKSSSQGFRLNARWLPHNQHTVSLSYLHLDTRFDSSVGTYDFAGNPFPLAPKNAATLVWQFDVTSDISLRTTGRYQDSSLDGVGNTYALPSNTVMDLGIHWSVNRNWNLQLNADNILDEQLETGRDSSGFSIANPAALRISVEWNG